MLEAGNLFEKGFLWQNNFFFENGDATIGL